MAIGAETAGEKPKKTLIIHINDKNRPKGSVRIHFTKYCHLIVRFRLSCNLQNQNITTYKQYQHYHFLTFERHFMHKYFNIFTQHDSFPTNCCSAYIQGNYMHILDALKESHFSSVHLLSKMFIKYLYLPNIESDKSWKLPVQS